MRHVTAASRAPGTDVVVLLTRESLPGSAAAAACLDRLAAAHPRVKCVRLSAEEALGPGYPDGRLPTVLVYREGDVALTLAGPAALGGGEGARSLTPEALARLIDGAPGGRVFNVSDEERELRQRELDLARGGLRSRPAGDDTEEGERVEDTAMHCESSDFDD